MKKLFAALTLATLGCSWLQSHPQVPVDIGQVVQCILQRDAAGESPTQIAVDCGSLAVQDVIAVLSAHKAAAQREACLRADAGPGK